MRLDDLRDDGEWRQRVGSAIRAARETKGLTQGQVAAQIGSDIATISKTELGKTSPDFATIFLIANTLEVSLDGIGRAALAGDSNQSIYSLAPAPNQPDASVRSVESRLQLLEEHADDTIVVAEKVNTLAQVVAALAFGRELPETLRDHLREVLERTQEDQS